MNAARRKVVIAARHKMAKVADRCDDGCPGWAVFDVGGALEIEACDDCWAHKPKDMRLTDDEAAAMPEALNALGCEMELQGLPASVWQRSLGYGGLDPLTPEEAARLQADLDAGEAYMAGVKSEVVS